MSAYAINQLPATIDSTFVPDLSVTGARPSTGHGIADGARPTRREDKILNAALVDLEPHWLAAVDSATD